MNGENLVDLGINTSVFGDVEITGVLAEIREYVKDMKRTLVFDYTRGGSISTNAFLYKDILYFSACDGIVYGINLDGKKTFEFKCPDIPWHPVVKNDIVYFGCYDGNLYAVNLEGKMLWKFPTRGKIVAEPAIADDTIYFGSEDGNLYAVTTEGKLLWKFPTMDAIATDAFAYENMVLVGSCDGNLYAVDRTTGGLLWKFSGRGGTMSSPIAYKNTIYVGSYDNNFYALTTKGKEIWRFTIKDSVTLRRPEADSDIIYLGSTQDCNFYAITPEGKVLWKYPMDAYSFITPTIYNKVVYFSNTEGIFFALDAKTGKKIWEFRTMGPLVSKPIAHNNRIYFGSWDCNFYCIDINGKPIWRFPTSSSAMASVNVPERIGEKISSFVLKPSETSKEEPYRATVSAEPIESIYAFSVSYKTQSEYKGTGKYRSK